MVIKLFLSQKVGKVKNQSHSTGLRDGCVCLFMSPLRGSDSAVLFIYTIISTLRVWRLYFLSFHSCSPLGARGSFLFSTIISTLRVWRLYFLTTFSVFCFLAIILHIPAIYPDIYREGLGVSKSTPVLRKKQCSEKTMVFRIIIRQ